MIHPSTLAGLDFETYCELDLSVVGLARYVSHPTFIATLASVATPDNGTFTLEFPKQDLGWFRQQLRKYTICAHNAGFERAVLKSMGIDIQVIDSAVVAAVAGADRHLAGAARQLMQADKLDEDRSLMRLFAFKQKGQVGNHFDRDLIKLHPDKWLKYKEYCERDAELSRGIIIDWAGDVDIFEREMRYAQLTLEMNEVGWPVDVDAVQAMRERYITNLDLIQDAFARNVDKDLNLASHVQVKKWCADRGVTSRSFDKLHVEQLIARLRKLMATKPLTQGQAEVMELLLVKQALGGSSLKKLDTIARTTYDGRVFDQYVHAGAGQSLRTSGRSIQMQNLPRLGQNPRNMDDLHSSRSRWTNDELAENLRQLFRSSHKLGQLLVGDFASIESRGLAYLAGEQWKTDTYTWGGDVYKEQAVKIFRLPDVTAVTKEQRTTGKVGELSCGYGAGPDAVKDFAAKMHVDLSETEAAQLVRDWRDANPNTVQFWNDLGDAMTDAVKTGQWRYVKCPNGIQISFGPGVTPASLTDQVPAAQTINMVMWKHGAKIMVRTFHGCYLRGRNVGYHKPSSLVGGKPWKDKYIDPKTKRPRFYELYGGKLAGILTQSMCREIFFESLSNIHRLLENVPNATIIGQFHDEIVIDWVPGPYSMTHVMEIMEKEMSYSTTHPALPMGAEIKRDYRYTK